MIKEVNFIAPAASSFIGTTQFNPTFATPRNFPCQRTQMPSRYVPVNANTNHTFMFSNTKYFVHKVSSSF